MVFVADARGTEGAESPQGTPRARAAWRRLGRILQVTGELKPGESVVVQGNERLMPGQHVSIVREAKRTGGEDSGKRNDQ